MRVGSNRMVCVVLFLLLPGCGSQPSPNAGSAPGQKGTVNHAPFDAGPWGSPSDPAKVRTADVSILFVGNSHTSFHDLPDLVCKMIAFRHPGKKVYWHGVAVAFLEDAARNPRCREEIESRPWKYVVLQAQKVSRSGRYQYSQKEGIDLAKRAKAKGATVFFFSEWGRKGVAGERQRHEKIYQEMARAADVNMAPVGRAWDLALSERPDLALHAADGNHQSPIGAFLTACVLYGRLTGESPAALASVSYLDLSETDRKFLANAAARALTQSADGADTR